MLGKPYGKALRQGLPSALTTLTGKLTFNNGFLKRLTEGNEPPFGVTFCMQASLHYSLYLMSLLK